METKVHFHDIKCRNPNLGFATKVRGCKVLGQEKDPGVTSHVPGSAKSVKEWTLTLPRELPCWELESRSPKWTSKFSKCDCGGQNPSPRKVLYIIGKLLKLRCLKWVRIIHLDIWNTSYGQKKGQESNWQFDSSLIPATKSRESTRFPLVQATCDKPLESCQRRLQLCFKPHRNRRFEQEVVCPQNRGSLVPGQKTIWMWPMWRGAKYTIRGKVVASPKFGLWCVLWVRITCGFS